MLFVLDILLNKSFFIIVKVFKNKFFFHTREIILKIGGSIPSLVCIDCALISHSIFIVQLHLTAQLIIVRWWIFGTVLLWRNTCT
jgi:hypothetical protein